MGISDWLGKTGDGLGQTAAELFDGYMKGQTARAQLDMTGQLAGMVMGAIANPRALELLKKMAADAAQDVLDAAVTDPIAAKVPAQHVLQAYAEIHRMAKTTLQWYQQRSRWHVRAPWEPAMFNRVEVAELTEQLQRIAGVLWMAARQCDYAGGKILQRHNPLRQVASDVHGIAPPSLELAECLFDEPQHRYHSANAQEKDVRNQIARLAIYLKGLAERGTQSIENASFNHGIAYSPAEVWAEAAVLAAKTVEGMASCAMLARLAQQPVGHGHEARNGHQTAPGAAAPKPLSAGDATPDSRQTHLTLLNGESTKPVPPAKSGTAS